MSGSMFTGGQTPAGLGHNGGPSLALDAMGFSDAEQRVWSFFVNQIARVNNDVFEIEYPNIRYQDLIPVDRTGNPWTQVVTYFSSDRVGQASWFAANAQDVPLVEMTRNAVATEVQLAAIGYGFNEQELAVATQLGQNLTTQKADICRRAAEEFIDRVALFGDATMNFTGLVNAPGVTTGTAPADGTGSSSTWASKTPTQVLRDFNGALNGIFIGTNSIEMADTVLLPLQIMSDLGSRAMSDLNQTPMLEYLRRNNSYTAETGRALTIRSLRGLETAGSGGTARMVAYRRAPDVLTLHMPMPFQFRQPWRKGPLRYEVPGIFRLGGVDVRRPSAFRYVDGI